METRRPSRHYLSVDDVERFRRGDEAGIRAVYRAYAGFVFAVALRRLGSPHLAEEVTQQTFVKAWQSPATFDPERDMRPWLTTIASRTAIDVHRREKLRQGPAVDDLPADHPDLVELPVDAERAADIWEVRAAIDDLSEGEREIVRLQHLEQLSHGEIADRLAMPLGTVKSRSHRAHRRLAARLGHLRDETHRSTSPGSAPIHRSAN